MAKAKTVFLCSHCAHQALKWQGQCPSCEQWNTLEECVPAAARVTNNAKVGILAKRLRDVTDDAQVRTSTGIGEFDRVLGGGVVTGSAILIGGDPGIGKSTLLLQMCHWIAKDHAVLYVSGEESAPQIKMRAKRLGCSDDVYLLCETDLELVCGQIESLAPQIVIIDSVQTMAYAQIPGAPGSVSQVREATVQLTKTAKHTGATVFLVGHVTKEGAIAGPRVLEHLVDTVLYFEGETEAHRILRAVKNRFGSTNEIGVFEMQEDGMHEVENPSALFLSDRKEPIAGCSVLCAMEGTRPVLAEVQALVSLSVFGSPRRMAAGIDYNRMILLAAVLEKKLGYNLANQDIYVNIAGGFKPQERACDIAVICAIASSFSNRPVQWGTLAIGEVGLTGELRAIGATERRVAECAKLGFTRMILPQASCTIKCPNKIQLIPVKNVAQALDAMLL